jgi:lycopene cyclase domain-containing protein
VTYTALAATGVVVVVLLDLLVVRTRLLTTRVFWLSYVIVVAFQLLVNGVLTGFDIVVYDPDTILGVRIAFAPVEDLLFGFAMTVTTLMAWTLLGRRRRPTPPRRARSRVTGRRRPG